MTHWSRIQRASLIGALVLASAVIAARWLPNVTPEGDMALLDLHAINVAERLEPVGLYSRFGWRHPGPLYSIVQLPVFWPSGYRHQATHVAALLVNAVAVCATFGLFRRHMGRALALAFGIVLTGFLAHVPGLLFNPWNPLAPLLSLPLLAAAAASVLAGHVRMLPVAVFVASLIVQAHVGLAAPVAAICVCVITALVVRVALASQEGRREATRAVVLASAVALAAWALPLWDALSPGGSRNIQALWAFFGSSVPADPRAAAGAFTRFVVAPLSPALAIPGGSPVPAALAQPALAAVQVTLLALAAIAFQWRGRRFEASWAWLTLAAIGAGLLSAIRLPEQPLDHTLFWASVLGVMSWTTILASGIDLVARVGDSSVLRRVLTLLPSVAAIAILAAGTLQLRASGRAGSSPLIRALAVPIRAELERAQLRSAILDVTADNWSQTAGVAALLRKQGYDPSVAAAWGWMFGPSMVTRRTDIPIFRIGPGGGDPAAGGFAPLAVVSTVPVFVQRAR